MLNIHYIGKYKNKGAFFRFNPIHKEPLTSQEPFNVLHEKTEAPKKT